MRYPFTVVRADALAQQCLHVPLVVFRYCWLNWWWLLAVGELVTCLGWLQ
jgi:hypothetical protein